MIAWIITLVFACAVLLWMLLFELRLARLLDLAEGTGDQADRALGFITAHAAWIADHAAPAVERIAAIAPELADALVSQRTAAPLPATQHDPPATAPEIPAQPRRRPRPTPMPGPATVPEQEAVAKGQRQAEGHANGREDPFLAAYRAELDRQMNEWRASIKEAK